MWTPDKTCLSGAQAGSFARLRGRACVSPISSLARHKLMRDSAPELGALQRAEGEIRPTVRGKFLFLRDRKLYVRGVTYGPFGPGETSGEERAAESVESDFAAMTANGVNTVRTYTTPSRRLLDLAWRHGLRVMVGLPWEQHVAFLDEKGRPE